MLQFQFFKTFEFLIKLSNKKRCVSISTRTLASKHHRIVAMISWCPFNDVVTWGHVTNKKKLYFYFHEARSHYTWEWWLMGRGRHSQCSHDTIITWQMKNVSSLFLQGSLLPNSTRWWLVILEHHAQIHTILWLRDHM